MNNIISRSSCGKWLHICGNIFYVSEIEAICVDEEEATVDVYYGKKDYFEIKMKSVEDCEQIVRSVADLLDDGFLLEDGDKDENKQ